MSWKGNDSGEWLVDATCEDCNFDTKGSDVCQLDIKKPEDDICSEFEIKKEIEGIEQEAFLSFLEG